MDLLTLEVNDTTTIDLELPDGSPMVDPATNKVCSITVYGPGTRQYARAQSVVQNIFMKRLSAGNNKKNESAEEKAEREATFLASCTKSLNNIQLGDMDVTDTSTIKALYLNPKLGFISAKVNREMGDWANFTKESPTS